MDLPDVDAIKADLAVIDIVETIDQVRDGRLAGARCANERNLLSGLGPQRDVVKNRLFSVVGEVNVFHNQLAAQTRVGDRSIAVRVTPCPHTRAFFGGMNIAILIDPCTDQGHVALVFFALLFHQGEDSGSTRKTQGDHRDLHRGLSQRLCKVTDHPQEGNNDANGDCAHTREAEIRSLELNHDAADQGNGNIKDIPDIAQGWHEHVAVLIRAF